MFITQQILSNPEYYNKKLYQIKLENYLKLSDRIFSFPNGLHQIYESNVFQEVHFVDGKKNGSGTLKTQDGRIYHLNFIDNIPQGPATRVDALGNILKYTLKDGRPLGAAIENIKNRHIEFSFGYNGLRHGTAQEHNPYGTIEFEYVNGVRSYPAKITGHDKKIYYLHYSRGKPNGHAKIFLPNDKIIYCNYANGYPQGEARMVLPNKNEILFHYAKNVPHGDALEITPLGHSEFTVDQGKIVYPVKFYNNASMLIDIAHNAQELCAFRPKYRSEIEEHVLTESLFVDHEVEPDQVEPDMVSTSFEGTYGLQNDSNQNSSNKHPDFLECREWIDKL